MTSLSDEETRRASAGIVDDVPALGPVPGRTTSARSTPQRMWLAVATAACLAGLGVGLGVVAQEDGAPDETEGFSNVVKVPQGPDGGDGAIAVTPGEPVERFCNDVSVVYSTASDASGLLAVGVLSPDGGWTPAGPNGEVAVNFCRGEISGETVAYLAPPELAGGTFRFCLAASQEPSTCQQVEVPDLTVAESFTSTTTTEAAEPGR